MGGSSAAALHPNYLMWLPSWRAKWRENGDGQGRSQTHALDWLEKRSRDMNYSLIWLVVSVRREDLCRL